jgi:pimeloyl-ACP methyl ester carboxylesterase
MSFITIGPGPIEYEHIHGATADAVTIVMLHEGLGSVAMWKDFPQRLARATSTQVLVYSRHGYGRSMPMRARRAVRYMHHEALVVLPRLLDELEIENPILFGHSDGASIALIHAASSGLPVAGIVALAPHVMVEDLSVSSISAAKHAYETTGLRSRLQRYHDDVDGAFWGWSDIWLDAAFRSWNIEAFLPHIACPILAIQGEQDEYGTMDQIERIGRLAPNAQLLRLQDCRHSPHRDRPDAVLRAVTKWIRDLRQDYIHSPRFRHTPL